MELRRKQLDTCDAGGGHPVAHSFGHPLLAQNSPSKNDEVLVLQAIQKVVQGYC